MTRAPEILVVKAIQMASLEEGVRLLQEEKERETQDIISFVEGKRLELEDFNNDRCIYHDLNFTGYIDGRNDVIDIIASGLRRHFIN